MADFSSLTGALLDRELATTDSTRRFTTSRRETAINEAILHFADLTECFVRESTIATSCNVATYNLLDSTVMGSSDFIRVAAQGVEYRFTSASSVLTVVAGEDFPRRDIMWLNQYYPGWRQSTTIATLPQLYYEQRLGGQYLIGVWPPPDVGSVSTASSARLIVPYVARPALLSASTDVPFTVGGRSREDLIPYHQGFVHYAASQLEKLRPDLEASAAQLKQFLGYVSRFLQSSRKKGPNALGNHPYLRKAQRRFGGGSVWDGLDPFRFPVYWMCLHVLPFTMARIVSLFT